MQIAFIVKDGKPIRATCAEFSDQAWSKFCDLNNQPPGNGRVNFIEMARQAGYDDMFLSDVPIDGKFRG